MCQIVVVVLMKLSPKETTKAEARKHLLCAGQPNDPPRQPLELWVAEVATGHSRCVTKMGLSSVFDE